jgi:hypothetical protein
MPNPEARWTSSATAVVDPEGQHEQLEQAWTAALPRDWPPPVDLEQLHARLRETVVALRPASAPALLELVSVVIVYLAAHPERRRVEQAVIVEAIHEAYGTNVPAELADCLARGPGLEPHPRHHGSPAPRRHLHSRPPLRPEAGQP